MLLDTLLANEGNAVYAKSYIDGATCVSVTSLMRNNLLIKVEISSLASGKEPGLMVWIYV